MLIYIEEEFQVFDKKDNPIDFMIIVKQPIEVPDDLDSEDVLEFIFNAERVEMKSQEGFDNYWIGDATDWIRVTDKDGNILYEDA